MRTRPDGFRDDVLISLLRERWGLDVRRLEYAAVGFGSYHWIATSTDGTRRFVTADKLDAMGVPDVSDVESNFTSLRTAYETAATLRDRGLGFVLAPLPNGIGEIVARLGENWAVGLFPFLEGAPAGDGSWKDERLWRSAAELIGRVHRALPPPSLRRWQCTIPYRATLGEALATLDASWETGPYGEQTRLLLRESQTVLANAFVRYDGLCDALSRLQAPWVVTHGEPHSANFVETADGRLVLIDWDTVRLAPPERDLWILMERGEDVLDAYQAATGAYAPRPEVLRLFGLQWMLADVCIYVQRFGRPHGDTVDDAASFQELKLWLTERLVYPT